MKIAFILTAPCIVPTDGVVSQARTWKSGIESLGHSVTLVNMWEKNDWKEFTAIVLFGFNDYLKDIVTWLYPINSNLIVAPILDPNHSLQILKFYSLWGSNKLRLSNSYHSLRTIKSKIKLFLVRSEFERRFVSGAFGIPQEKCMIVPLSYNYYNPQNKLNEKRESFCLHISLLCDERKNVRRLIEASEKYDFKLVLCGMLRSDTEEKLLASWMDGKKNVIYKGYVSKDEMIELYRSAKVFALPSIYEGVGIVALDAAAMGCDIVITKLGGPKEYYQGQAIEVDPYDTDEIGRAIKVMLEGKTYQPELSQYILYKYSLSKVSQILVQTIEETVNENQ